METKRCSKCGETKPLGAFNRDKSRTDGRQSTCRSCKRAICAKYYTDNLAKALDYVAKYRAENKTKVRESRAKWYAEKGEKARRRQANLCAELHPSYVARTLHLSVAKAPPDLLKAKREQLLYHRITTQLIATIKEIQNV